MHVSHLTRACFISRPKIGELDQLSPYDADASDHATYTSKHIQTWAYNPGQKAHPTLIFSYKPSEIAHDATKSGPHPVVVVSLSGSIATLTRSLVAMATYPPEQRYLLIKHDWLQIQRQYVCFIAGFLHSTIVQAQSS